MRDIKDILKAWANVSMSFKIGLGFPYKSSAFIGAKRENHYKPMLNEDEFDIVQEAMYTLAQANKGWHGLLIGLYLEGKTYERLSIISCMSYKKTKSEIEKAETYIFAKLDDKIHDIAA